MAKFVNKVHRLSTTLHKQITEQGGTGSATTSSSSNVFLAMLFADRQSLQQNVNKQQGVMATASILQWVPDSLYNLSVSITACNYDAYRAEVKSLPDSVLFDVLYKVRRIVSLPRLSSAKCAQCYFPSTQKSAEPRLFCVPPQT